MAAAPTPGSTDLSAMLRSLEPALDQEIYVFCTFPAPFVPANDSKPDESSTTGKDYLKQDSRNQQRWPIGLPVKCLFEESEGTTIITTQEAAVSFGIEKYFFPCKCVTISVHSSLDAVGLLAALTTHLARDLQIGVNPVSAFYHDHLFVPLGTEDDVMESLKRLAAGEASK